MKQILPILLIFNGFILRGQTVTVTLTPQTVNTAVHPDSFEVKAKANFKNTATTTKKFTWSRSILNITAGWQSLVCDPNSCWTAAVSTAPQEIELVANAVANLDVYIRPNHISGAATIEMKISEVGNPTNTVTGRYLFSPTTATKDLSKTANIKIYPNPATDFFMLQDEHDAVDRVVVYNIIGRQVKIYKATEGFRYTLSDLPEGIYLVRLLNANGATVKTIRLSKAKAKA